MKKRNITIILLLLVLMTSICLFWMLGRQWLKVDGVNAVINNDSRTIFVSIPEGTLSRKVTFNFPFNNRNVFIKKLTGENTVYNNPKIQKFNSGQSFDFDGFISHYKLIVGSSNSPIEYDLWITTGDVPVLSIEAKEDIPTEPKVDCSINILSKKTSYNKSGIDAEIELVDASEDVSKTSYSLNIRENIITGEVPVLLDFVPVKRFRLSRLYPDRSFMREKLAYDIFKSFSDENLSPDSRYIELFLNGEYKGLYLFSTRADRVLFDLSNFNKKDAIHSVLYETTNWRADFSRGIEGFSQIEPDYKNDGYYYAPLEELIKLITQKETRDFLSEVEKSVDMDNLMDNHILFLLSGCSNDIASNQYIYRGSEKGAKFKFCPGSFYISGFGRDENSKRLNPTKSLYPSRLYNRLYENETYREELKKRWHSLRKDIITLENFYRIIDENASLLLQAQNRDLQKWPLQDDLNDDAYSYNDEIEYIKGFLKERISWLDSIIDNPPLLKIGETYAYIDEESRTIFCSLPQDSKTSQKISWFFSPGLEIYLEPLSQGDYIIPKKDYEMYKGLIDNGENTGEITIFVDKPLENSVLKNEALIYGWAVNPEIKVGAGVKSIVLFDGPVKDINKFIGVAHFNFREDVAQYFNNINYGEGGFEINFDTRHLENGPHELYLYAIDNKGDYSLSKINVQVSNTATLQKNYGKFKINNGQDYDFNEFIFNGILTVKNKSVEKNYNFYLTNCDIPLVIINTNNTDIPDNNKIEAGMKVIYNDSNESNFINRTVFDSFDNIGIELRGKSSKDLFPKKQYSVEVRNEKGEDSEVSILGMPAESDWVLSAPYSDKTLMRNVLAFELSNQMGLNASKTQYVEVFLDVLGKQITQPSYRGVYVLTESVKRNKNRVDVEKLDSDKENLISGGYILEISSMGKINPGESYFKTYRGTTLINKYPRIGDITEKQKIWITDYMNEFESVLYGESFKDKDEGYQKYIDIDSFIDYIIINELFKNRDIFGESTFIYKGRYGKLKMGPVWDFDLSSGNIIEDPEANGPYYFRYTKLRWTNQLFQDEYFVEKYISRWKELRKIILSNENINLIVDNNAELLSEAQVRNFEQWEILGKYVWPVLGPYPETYDEEIEKLKSWFSARTKWIDENIDSLLQVY